MRRFGKNLSRALLPLGVFVAVAVAHYCWCGFFPEPNPIQDRWAAVALPESKSWLKLYFEDQNYWLGYSYALSLAFAAVALRRYREERFCTHLNLALGGVTFSGFLAVAGCFLLGCCGSPMLVVYLNLFGASFLPLAKPLLAALTTISILGAWWWMNRQRRQSLPDMGASTSSNQTKCNCN